MADEGQGRVFSSGEANTLFVSIPSDVAIDSVFPFDEGEEVIIQIEGGRMIVKSIEE